MTQRGVRLFETSFETPTGQSLYRRAWLPMRPERVLILVHGILEHCGRYAAFARWMADRGVAVHAYDQRGHGRSGGRRAHVAHFSYLVEDLFHFLGRVESEHANLPTFALGVSMGGLVLANGLAQGTAKTLAGAMLVGAAFAPGTAISKRQLRLIRFLRYLLPCATLPFAIDAEALSHDADEVMAYLSDPLVQPHAKVGLAAAILAGMERLSEVPAPVGLPVFVAHGDEDQICAVEAAWRYAEAAGDANARLRIYPGLRHDLLHERDRATLFRDLLVWMKSLEGNSYDR